MALNKSAVSFENVRRMSSSSLNKLNKDQLQAALKDAIDSSNRRPDAEVDPVGIASLVSQEINKVLQPLIKHIEQLTSDYKALREELNSLHRSFEVNQEKMKLEILEEMRQRNLRRKCIIVSGVEEHQSGTISDKEDADRKVIKDIFEEIDCENVGATNVRRIGRRDSTNGKPRLICVTVESKDDKMSTLRNSKKLRTSDNFKGVYINPDMTIMERNQRKTLLEELKRRRELGENVVIRHNKIVSAPSLTHNFR